MKTLKLEINNKIYDKVLWLLHQFNPEDLKVIEENNATKKYLSRELEDIDKGNAKFISIEDLENILEERIMKYENKNS